MTTNRRLPIEDVLPEILDGLATRATAVIEAPTGAGKSTRVPPAIADRFPDIGTILVVQPRRVAARAVARRIAEERGQRLGGEVGYQVRFDRKASADTRILVVTDGILLRMLQDDPFLEGIGAICFDEFHERRLNTDLGLALARRVRDDVRPDLQIIVMSATLDVGPISAWLDAPRINSEGRTFPVDIRYDAADKSLALSGHILRVLRRELPNTDGDVLVFLPGVGEIRDAHDSISQHVDFDELEVLELYGSLPPEKQDRVFDESARRRVILATNVAETSVTIPNVRTVIDSGLARVMRIDPSTGFDRLRIEPISIAEADQRAGRAGRTSAGVAVRLWAQNANRLRDEYPTAEIRRVDIADALLELFAWGETDPLQFPWFEAPEPAGVSQALKLLADVGLVDDLGITSTGRMARQLALPPRLAAFLVYASGGRQNDVAALAAAILSERDVFLRSFSDRVGNTGSESDIDDRIRALREKKWQQHVHRGAAASVRKLHKKLGRDIGNVTSTTHPDAVVGLSLGESFAMSFPDRIAKFRDGDERRAVTVDGRGLYLHESSSVSRSPLFVALEVVDANTGFAEALCVKAVGIEESQIPQRLITHENVYEFVEGPDRVEVRQERRCGAIVLSSENSDTREQARVSQILVAAALEDVDRALGLDGRELTDRWTFAALNSDEVPTLDSELWERVIEGMAMHASSFADLRRANLSEHLYSAAGWQTKSALDRLAPEHLEVPSGNRIRLDYSDPESPVLPVKIQELFGATETPRIAGGRVPVTIHLLAPNRRPQQVTQDLASFWANTYPEVRKELRQRYAKHPWPEDPLTAPATAKTKKAYERSRGD